MTKQVTVAQLIEAAQATLLDILPKDRPNDARAVSFAHGTLTIVAGNSPAGKFLNDRKAQLREQIIVRVPSADIRDIYIRIGSVDVLE